jgi:predicted Zn finger-like uncharacterized protein
MPLAVTCPHCRTPHRLADELEGRLIRCKECGKSFRVGSLQRDDADDRPRRRRDADDSVDDRPRRRRSSSSSPSSLVLLIVIGMVFAVGVTIVGGAAVWYLMSGQRGRPRIVTQRPNPGVVVQNRPGVFADHTIFPPRPAGVGQLAEAPEGEIKVTLTNPRRVEGIMANQPTYQFDYQMAGDLPKRGKDMYHLVTKVPEGLCDTIARFAEDKDRGTVSFNFIPGHDPGPGFEAWIEWEPFGKRKERVRVSKPVTFN